MKQPIYKRDCHISSLVFEQEWIDSTAYFQIQMLIENKIKGLLFCSIHLFNGENQVYYDITGKQTLSCIYEKKKMQAKDMELLLFGLKNALLHMQEYLLDENYILLSPEYIYMDLSTRELSFCFYPFEQGDFMKSIVVLAEYLLEKIDHEENEAVVAAYQFYRLVKEENPSFIQITEQLYDVASYKNDIEEKTTSSKEVIIESKMAQTDLCSEEIELPDKLEEETKSHTPQKEKGLFYVALCLIVGGLCYGAYCYSNGFAATMHPRQPFYGTKEFLTSLCLIVLGIIFWGFSFFFYKTKNKQIKEQEIFEDNVDYTVYREFPEETSYIEAKKKEETDFIEDSDELTVLLAEKHYKEERCLISTDRKKFKIALTEFPFVIGKMEGVVDYVLQDKSVSRIHVKFLYNEEEDTVYIQDLNSTNGTYHNGIRLESNEILPIYAEDEIRIGKRIFIYQ